MKMHFPVSYKSDFRFEKQLNVCFPDYYSLKSVDQLAQLSQ